jgi:hypothetical protein
MPYPETLTNRIPGDADTNPVAIGAVRRLDAGGEVWHGLTTPRDKAERFALAGVGRWSPGMA